MNISKEEYLQLIEQYANEQYGGEQDLSDTYDISEDAWMPAESPNKENMLRALNSNRSGSADLTNVRKDKIQEALYKCTNIKVDSFLVRIERYSGEPDKFGKGVNLTMDISIWEERYKTPSGNPCRLTCRMNLHKDDRFENRPWLHQFSQAGTACDIPVETVVDIIKWMQAIKRMSAFL